MSIGYPTADTLKGVEIPARIASELELIEAALRNDSTDAVQWGQLYAAQQALCWAASEALAAAPYAVITEGRVQPTGIPAN